MALPICRYGGDEFTVIFQASAEGVETWIATLRENIRGKQLENRLPYDLKLSVGWEAMRDENDTMPACLERADAKLYDAKRKT